MISVAEMARDGLEFTPELAAATSEIYDRVKDVIPEIEWPVFAPYIDAINRLKKEKNAVILAHNYQTPEIFHGVADIVGDSLALAREAVDVDADIIILCGVHFMAETAKLLNPEKTVLIPDLGAGCSLSESITGADVRLLKERFPGVPVVTYVNTSADVKAETDVCCTSSNALHVVESLGVDRVLFLPDEYLAQNVARQTDVEILAWRGRCMVHEQFSAREIEEYRDAHPGIVVLAHPECPPDVLEVADYAGSTSGMINYAKQKQPPQIVMITECSMSDNVAAELPNVDFIRPCNLCPHMKKITLPAILRSLRSMQHQVEIAPEVADRARLAVQRMLDIGTPPADAAQWQSNLPQTHYAQLVGGPKEAVPA
ncbi:MAG TPA: quinolinate synthase [Alphaproteobacteria bacterium]|nr:quinolinate synthase [Alphaproteobacteria bacterium]